MGDAGRRAPQARTRLARRAVLDAARDLFLERGYGATTIEAISDASDVPQATLYRLFSSKLGILKDLLDSSIAGDDEPVAVAERPHVESLLGSVGAGEPAGRAGGGQRRHQLPDRTDLPDPRERRRLRPEAAVLLDDLARQRHEGQGRFATSLARSGALRSEVTPREAADVIHALASPEVYRLLVLDRGWSSARFEGWLASALAAQLLAQ